MSPPLVDGGPRWCIPRGNPLSVGSAIGVISREKGVIFWWGGEGFFYPGRVLSEVWGFWPAFNARLSRLGPFGAVGVFPWGRRPPPRQKPRISGAPRRGFFNPRVKASANRRKGWNPATNRGFPPPNFLARYIGSYPGPALSIRSKGYRHPLNQQPGTGQANSDSLHGANFRGQTDFFSN